MWYNLSMDGLANLFIVILAGMVHASLQLGVSALLLLYHANLGKQIKTSVKKLAKNYIFGISLFTALALASTCFFILVIFSGSMPPATLVIVTGVLVAFAVGIWFLYYKRGTGTELWIPRSFAKFINERAEQTDEDVEAFSLGMTMACAELPFAAILIITAGDAILDLPQGMQILSIAVYVLSVVAPMLILNYFVSKGKTIVDIQKWRVKNKNFIKIMSGVGFVVLAIFLLAFKVLKDF